MLIWKLHTLVYSFPASSYVRKMTPVVSGIALTSRTSIWILLCVDFLSFLFLNLERWMGPLRIPALDLSWAVCTPPGDFASCRFHSRVDFSMAVTPLLNISTIWDSYFEKQTDLYRWMWLERENIILSGAILSSLHASWGLCELCSPLQSGL